MYFGYCFCDICSTEMSKCGNRSLEFPPSRSASFQFSQSLVVIVFPSNSRVQQIKSSDTYLLACAYCYKIRLSTPYSMVCLRLTLTTNCSYTCGLFCFVICAFHYIPASSSDNCQYCVHPKMAQPSPTCNNSNVLFDLQSQWFLLCRSENRVPGFLVRCRARL